MEVFSALQVDTRDPKITYIHQGKTMMADPCSLNLVLERNLEWAFGRQGLWDLTGFFKHFSGRQDCRL